MRMRNSSKNSICACVHVTRTVPFPVTLVINRNCPFAAPKGGDYPAAAFPPSKPSPSDSGPNSVIIFRSYSPPSNISLLSNGERSK